MVGQEGSGHCQEAQLYYHDFLQDRGGVPRSVAEHIDSCDHCRTEVERLGRILSRTATAENPHRSHHSRELIAELQSHFDHVGEQVTCSQVRRFMPGLLADRVRIPTPVTVHIDQCDRCREDLEHLRALGLTQEQLARLEEIYSEPTAADPSLCRQVKLMLAETDDLRLEDLPAPVAEHICACPQCRGRVYETRQDLLYHCQQRQTVDPYIRCGRIVDADLFEFVVLRGAEAFSRTSPTDRHRTVAEHVFSCPRCLAKVQHMHQVIFGMAERPDSGIATVYATTGAQVAASKKDRNFYAAYPIEIHVIGGKLKTVRRRARRSSTLAAALKRKLRGRKLRSLAPATAVATVMILLLGLYVVSSQSALGLNIAQIRRAQARVPSVHVTVTSYSGSGNSYTRQLWASDPAELFATETPDEQVVFDIHDRTRIAPASDGSLSRTPLTQKQYENNVRFMRGQLDFDVTGFSTHAELQHPAAPLNGISAALEVYETAAENDPSALKRMVFYLDSTSRLLQKTELYGRTSPDQGWELKATRSYEYPTKDEVLQRFSGLITRN